MRECRRNGQQRLFNYRRQRTPEDLGRYYDSQQPDAAVVTHLRAGIAEFRAMLNARDALAALHALTGAPKPHRLAAALGGAR